MGKTNRIVEAITDDGAVAVIRMKDSRKVTDVAEALIRGGLRIMEVTLTVPHAFNQIKKLSRDFGDSAILGAGTVLTEEDADRAIEAGARFIVSPVLKLDLIRHGMQCQVPVFPAGLTPTEIQTAFEAGAELVKVFPAQIVGMDFIKAMKGPLPQIPLMPTGGVTPGNAGEWILAGASCVGVGGALLDKMAVAEARYDILTKNAALLKKNVLEARRTLSKENG